MLSALAEIKKGVRRDPSRANAFVRQRKNPPARREREDVDVQKQSAAGAAAQRCVAGMVQNRRQGCQRVFFGMKRPGFFFV
ncbi:MAG: hypothetical protein IPO76_08590 [Elusimicrobia bacterium]|nr:hypothetical protein [Elusimicrobiota bacterium]MBK7575056.1 hypothetical protein [Elusimicrobiota bacterium]MBK7687678.1 hypothetical protein [Elusimicrobiota bacterium]MBK8651805.1 hypothetical protein [Elusimicrobiota bacterium]MBK9056813.1 hypothetical protein [Elusimicrobiota bacterium]